MRITIRNNAGLSNKNIRFIKWKINSMRKKFNDLLYAEVHLNTEGQKPKTFKVNIRLGIEGHDIIIQNKSQHLGELFQKSTQSVHRYLAKHKTKKNEVFHKKIN